MAARKGLVAETSKTISAHGELYYLSSSDAQAERERLSLQHSLWVDYLDGQLFIAPIARDVHSILDIGCGSGAWTLDVAARYPAAKVLGVDLTPPKKPEDAPRNCSFLKANIEDEWTFLSPGTKFGFIYGRMLANGIHNWPQIFTRCYEHLHPGGWIEIPDVRVAGLDAKDGSMGNASPAIRWFEMFQAAAVRTGIDPYANEKHTQRLREAGFVNIEERPVEWLVGGAGGLTEKERRIGDIHLSVIHTLITGVTESLLQYEPGVEPSEVQELAARAKEDLTENHASRGYFLHLSLHLAQKSISS